MKKVLFVVFAVLMLTFAAASAQETAEAEQTLNFSTLGDMFSWDTPAEDVYNTLKEYENFELEVEEDEKYGKTITATAQNDEETFIYVFYFDNDTEKLWEIEAVAVLYDGEQVIPAFQALYEAYGLEKANAYENENLQAYAADFDSAYIAAGDYTIALLAGSEETDESYGKIALVLIDRNYFEN